MRQPTKGTTEPPFKRNLLFEVEDLLTGQEPIAEYTEVLMLLLEAAPDALPERYLPKLYRLLGLLNTMQLVQINMERMVSHA